jgi:hypothetical protein
MFGALDLVANSDWVSILPGIMMASDIDRDLFTINVIVEPQLILDLVLIEPMRQPMGLLAETFLNLLEDETARISARLGKIPATVSAGERASGQCAEAAHGRVGNGTLQQAKTTTEAPA